MLFRWSRAFSKFNSNPISRGRDDFSSDSNFERTMMSLSNLDNYNKDNVVKVIRGYYFAFAGARSESRRVKFEENSVIKDSLKLLAPFIPGLHTEGLFLLIKNLGMLRIRDPQIWTIIERAFIENGAQYMRIDEIGHIANSFATVGVKSEALWKSIEGCILTNVYPDHELSASGVSDVLRSFTIVDQGTEELYNHLINDIKKHMPDLKPREIEKIFFAHQKLRRIDNDFFTLLLDRTVEIVDEIKFTQLSNILTSSVTLGARPNYLEVFEQNYLSKLFDANIYHLCLVSSVYGRFLSEEIAVPGKRREFLEKLESFYLSKRDTVVSLGSYSFASELKFFWGLAKAGIFTNDKAWKEVYEHLNSEQGQRLISKLGEYSEFLKAYIKERI